MRARAVVAAFLICGIVSVGHSEEQIDRIFRLGRIEGVACDANHLPAECGYMLRAILENIVVSKQTPNVEMFPSLPDFDEVKCLDFKTASHDLTFGANQRSEILRCHGEIKILWEGFIEQPAIYVRDEINSGSTPRILIDWSDSREIGARLAVNVPMPFDEKLSWENKRSLELYKRSFSDISRTISGIEPDGEQDLVPLRL